MTEVTGPGEIAGRLLETREFLGYTREAIEAACELGAGRLAALEDGAATPAVDELEKIARLYRRPVPWFYGENQFTPSPEQLRLLEGMTEGDGEIYLQYAEWLKDAGPPSAPQRRATGS